MLETGHRRSSHFSQFICVDALLTSQAPNIDYPEDGVCADYYYNWPLSVCLVSELHSGRIAAAILR